MTRPLYTTSRTASASVARSLDQLVKREVLAKSERGYRFEDPFFKSWVLSKIP
jgi:hypothetical protein